jgi:hypothetical protein
MSVFFSVKFGIKSPKALFRASVHVQGKELIIGTRKCG